MRFPNAKKGIRNIFRSEIIMLFFDLATAIVSILVMVAGADLNKIALDEISGLTLVFMILGLVALLSLLIGGIFRIVGFLQAARDDQGFRLAIFFTLSAVLFNFAQSFFQTKGGALGWVHAILSVLGVIAQMLVTVYAIGGMMSLSRKSHRDDLVGKGKTILKVLLATYACRITAFIITEFVRANDFNQMVATLLTYAIAVLTAVQYLLYLPYLFRVGKMLGAEKS